MEHSMEKSSPWDWVNSILPLARLGRQRTSPRKPVISPFPAFLPIVSRDPIIVFTVTGGLLTNATGSVNAYANRLLDLSFTLIPIRTAAPLGRWLARCRSTPYSWARCCCRASACLRCSPSRRCKKAKRFGCRRLRIGGRSTVGMCFAKSQERENATR
jgi:hypothetical protein